MEPTPRRESKKLLGVKLESLSAAPPSHPESGYKSSEFHFAVALILLDLASACASWVPAEHAVAFATVVGVAYKAFRTLLKMSHSKDAAAVYIAELENSTDLVSSTSAQLSVHRPGEAGCVEPRTLAASVLLAFFFLAALAWLNGCSSMSSGTAAKWKATGAWLADKTAQIAIKTIIAAAQSQTDEAQKADWLDSLATGARAQALAGFSGDDIRALIGIWSPARDHWKALADQIAALVDQAKDLPPALRAEAIARGLQGVAASVRIAQAQAGPQATIVTRTEAALVNITTTRKPEAGADKAPRTQAGAGLRADGGAMSLEPLFHEGRMIMPAGIIAGTEGAK